MKPHLPVRLLTLARELSLPASWLRQEAIAGRIPCLRVGRTLLFNMDAVRKALDARAASADASENGGTHV